MLLLIALLRVLKKLKEAERRLENDESKLLYGLFWFLTCDSVDELALDCLSRGDIDKANLIWSQQIEKSENPKFSWKLNRSVVSFFRMESDGFDEETLATILEDIGYVIWLKWVLVLKILLVY